MRSRPIPILPRLTATWAVLLADLGRKDEAEEQFRLAIKADPNLAAAYCNLGVLLADLGRKDEAEEQFRLAIKADPNLAGLTSTWACCSMILAERMKLWSSSVLQSRPIPILPGLLTWACCSKILAERMKLWSSTVSQSRPIPILPELTSTWACCSTIWPKG